MLMRCCSLVVSIVVVALFSVRPLWAQNDLDESHAKVAMRLIGHEVLLSLGDSSSRVLPIEKEEHGYRIRFESEFGFDPDSLVSTIKRTVLKTGMAQRYLVEVEQCETHDLVYSYMVAPLPENSMIACKERMQPIDCYTLYISILDAPKSIDPIRPDDDSIPSYAWAAMAVGLLLIPVFWLSKRAEKLNPSLISIGVYQFDRLNNELLYKNERNELTGKESELLFLLYSSANQTVSRETILKEVWGDEGDYIGRTLDVFISKLRKKLEADTNIKIVNVRGVGYKFVMQ